MNIITLKYSTSIFLDLLKAEDKLKMFGRVFVFQLGHEKGAYLQSFFFWQSPVSKSQKEIFMSAILQKSQLKYFHNFCHF